MPEAHGNGDALRPHALVRDDQQAIARNKPLFEDHYGQCRRADLLSRPHEQPTPLIKKE